MSHLLCKLSFAALLAAAPLLSPAAGAQGAGRQFTVTMENMSYNGLPSAAKVGDVIVWDNNDTVQHSATARDGSFDVRLLPGKTARTVLKKAGTINVYCIYHSTMRGSLKVAGG